MNRSCYTQVVYSVFLCDVFLMFFLDNFKSDCVLRTMFLSKSDAVQSVWQAFENYSICEIAMYYVFYSTVFQSRLNVLGGPGPARLMGPLSSLWPTWRVGPLCSVPANPAIHT